VRVSPGKPDGTCRLGICKVRTVETIETIETIETRGSTEAIDRRPVDRMGDRDERDG
jgi:hypothetical protein